MVKESQLRNDIANPARREIEKLIESDMPYRQLVASIKNIVDRAYIAVGEQGLLRNGEISYRGNFLSAHLRNKLKEVDRRQWHAEKELKSRCKDYDMQQDSCSCSSSYSRNCPDKVIQDAIQKMQARYQSEKVSYWEIDKLISLVDLCMR